MKIEKKTSVLTIIMHLDFNGEVTEVDEIKIMN